MKTEKIHKPAMKLIGLSLRTNNANEMHPETSKIGSLVNHYFGDETPMKISTRMNPNTTYSVYTDYAGNEQGDYTYFIGEEVENFDNVPEGLQTLEIPAAQYQKFTTDAGPMPAVVINAWKQIWKMTPEELGGERSFQTDFEVYDERAMNPPNTSLDIYIGIK